jgi:hypothetical protein
VGVDTAPTKQELPTIGMTCYHHYKLAVAIPNLSLFDFNLLLHIGRLRVSTFTAFPREPLRTPVTLGLSREPAQNLRTGF